MTSDNYHLGPSHYDFSTAEDTYDVAPIDLQAMRDDWHAAGYKAALRDLVAFAVPIAIGVAVMFVLCEWGG
jgi:hypothetical protein